MTRHPGRLLVGAAFGVAAAVATVAGSHTTLTGMASDAAVIRLSWSARPERVETCRRVSDEALAKLPAHMRRRVICEGTTARYALSIERDSLRIGDAVVRGGGLRHDRELYVARDFEVAPGRTRIVVRFTRLDSSAVADEADRPGHPADSVTVPAAQGAPADRSAREAEERMRRRAEAIPPALVIDTTVFLEPRRVLLFTYDEIARRLVVRH